MKYWQYTSFKTYWNMFYSNAWDIQYIPTNMHTVFALLCFVVVIHWLIFPYPSGLLHWHCGNLTIAPVPAKQPWWIWISTSCETSMNDYITTTKQSTTKPCAYFLGYTTDRAIISTWNALNRCIKHSFACRNNRNYIATPTKIYRLCHDECGCVNTKCVLWSHKYRVT